MAIRAREDAAGAILNYDDKMITIDFMSWDPLPWTESWDITAYGTEGVMHSTPLPASYKLYSTGKAGLPEGWTEWNENELPRDLGGAENRLFAGDRRDRQPGVLRPRSRGLRPTRCAPARLRTVPASQAHNINVILEALFESAELNGQEVILAQ